MKKQLRQVSLPDFSSPSSLESLPSEVSVPPNAHRVSQPALTDGLLDDFKITHRPPRPEDHSVQVPTFQTSSAPDGNTPGYRVPSTGSPTPMDREPLVSRRASHSYQSSQPIAGQASPGGAPTAPMPPRLQKRFSSSLQMQRLRRRSRRRSQLWSLAWVLGTAIFSGMGVVAYQWLTLLPPAPDCQHLSPLAADGDRLYCAQVAAQSGELDSLVAGINLIKDWKPSHPMFRKAQTPMNQWSAKLLMLAETALKEDGLDRAVEIASYIPEGSPLYEEAEERIAGWRQQWQQGDRIYQVALDAIENQDWERATEQVTALGKLQQPYWREERSNELSIRIVQEKEARQTLDGAIALATSGTPDQVVEAIVMAREIQPQTLAWNDAQPLVQAWGQTLIDRGMEAVRAGELKAAVGWVQHVPINQVTEGESSNLLRYAYARQLAEVDTVPWQVNPFEGFRLAEAIAATQHIPADSQFYGMAQAAIAQWQLELDNLQQLQLAQWMAQLGNRYALDLAIRQATLIAPDHPRRLQAQTLIAHWNQEIQRIVDRPQLALAERMAEPGTLEALRAAIAQAKSIGVDRALWPQVEVAVTQWTQQVQALEDRPILVQARELAAQGKWREAIAQASSIGAQRSLYSVAQDNIAEWQAELQSELDAENLAEARSLASRIRLTQAIHLASQIAPGRPLYNEAQDLISQWVAERDRIRRQRAQPSPARTPEARSTSDSSQNAQSNPIVSDYEGYYDSRYYDYHQ